MDNRIIYSNNGVLSDFSVSLNNYHQNVEAMTFVAAEDKLYVGSYWPFNHFFLKLGAVKNTAASKMSMKYWNGNAFVAVNELFDETSVGGASLGQDGYVSFVPSKKDHWQRETTNEDGQTVIGLTGINIYDRYWVEISFDSDLDAGVELSWLGQIFSNDDDLGGEYGDLVRTSVIQAIDVNNEGKTDFEEQAVIAARFISKELRRMDVIKHKGEILEREDLIDASVSKVAELIFKSLGPDYLDDKRDARKEFTSRIGKYTPRVDKDGDAILTPNENLPQQGKLSRRGDF